LREAKKKIEGYEGKNMENKTKNELLLIQKQLSDAQRVVNSAIEKAKH
jgi:hypothetical protein